MRHLRHRAARTAIGTFGGALKDVSNTQLATTAVRAALTRSGFAPDAVGRVVMGNVIPTEPPDAYLSRVAAIDAGMPIETPASGLKMRDLDVIESNEAFAAQACAVIQELGSTRKV